MVTIRPAAADDLERIIELFRRSNDSPYPLDSVAEEKCFGRGLDGAPEVLLAKTDEGLAGIAVRSGRHLRLLAVDRGHRRRGIATKLLREVECQLRPSGETLNVAAEAGNYFVPGVHDADCGTLRFFERHGFSQRKDEPLNLHCSLRTIEFSESAAVRRPAIDERDAVVGWISDHFGRALSFEAERAFETSLPSLFIAESGGELAGFSGHDINNRGMGFYGPLGVLERFRKQGLGRALLHASLRDLAEKGYTQVYIAWTDAVEFYQRACGATVAHRFIRFEKATGETRSG